MERGNVQKNMIFKTSENPLTSGDYKFLNNQPIETKFFSAMVLAQNNFKKNYSFWKSN